MFRRGCHRWAAKRGGLMLSSWIPALAATLLLLTVFLAGCGGDSPDNEGEDIRPPAAATEEADSIGEPEDTTTEEGSSPEPEHQTTRQGTLGSAISSPAADSEATEEPGGIAPGTGEGRDNNAGESEAKFTSISAGPRYTCGIRLDESIQCWGDSLTSGLPLLD